MRLSRTMTIAAAAGKPGLPGLALSWRHLQGWLRSGHTGLAICANYFQAAAMYEALHRLSPAELERRGFSRGSLARDLCGLDDNSVA
jgi:hypothetical protein